MVTLKIKGYLSVTMLKLLGRLPLLWARGLGRLLGYIAVLKGSDGLRISNINLQLCYPTMAAAKRKQLARQSMISALASGGEMASIWCQPWSRIERRILHVRNRELLHHEGRGMLLLVPHTGNWEILGLYLATLGPMTSLYAPPKIPALDPIIRASREATGARLVQTDIRGVRSLFKALKAGSTVGILPDQEPDLNGGSFAPLFGRPALTMTLAHNLLQRTGCRCVFGVGKRVAGGFELIFLPAEEAIYSSAQSISLAALNRGVEACIAEAPEQYQWEYKRFRMQPEGKSTLYRRP